jgi:flagella basal body P-ring formation protein FlgA
MIRPSIALALLIVIGGSANAATPRLKELVTVTSEIVRIGDLVENAGAATDVPVFRAPDLGQTGAVPVSQVTEALRPYDMNDIDTAGLTATATRRTSA